MSKFFKAQVIGASIQYGSFFAIAIQNFLVPRLYGPKEYGLAIYLLTIPYLIQGLMEPVVTSLTIKWLGDDPKSDVQLSRVASLWRDCIYWGLIGAIIALFFVIYEVGYEYESSWAVFGLLILCLTILSVITTLILAIVYALKDYQNALKGTLIAGSLLPLMIWLFREAGAIGFLLVLCLNYITLSSGLLVSEDVRNSIKKIISHTPIKLPHKLTILYLPIMSSRLTLVFLNTGTVILAGMTMTFADVAAYKVTLSLIAAGTYLLPVSPAVFQSALMSSFSKNSKREHRDGILLLGTVFIGGCIMAIFLFLWGDSLRMILLGNPLSQAKRFDTMFFALPFFVMINPLSAYYTAMGREKLLLWAFFMSFISAISGFLIQDLSFGFILGTISFVIFAIGFHLYFRKKNNL